MSPRDVSKSTLIKNGTKFTQTSVNVLEATNEMAKDALALALERLNSAKAPQETLTALKSLKTALIGNKSRKFVCCQDLSNLTRLAKLVTRANNDPASTQIKVQAVTILGVLSLAVEDILLNLLHADIPAALWVTFREAVDSCKSPSLVDKDVRDLLVALLRAFKSFYSALLQVVGPRRWGAFAMPVQTSSADATIRVGKMRVRLDQLPTLARTASAHACIPENVSCMLSILVRSSDAYLESLQPAEDPSVEGSEAPARQAAAIAWHTTICELSCELIAHTVRSSEQQAQLLGHDTLSKSALKAMVRLVDCGQVKIEEAALLALSAVIHNSSAAATAIDEAADFLTSVLWLFVAKADARSPTLQLAATQCFAHFYVAKFLGQKGNISSCRTPISVLLRLLSEGDGFEAPAASILAYLVTGSSDLQGLAGELGALRIVSDKLSLAKPESGGDQAIQHIFKQECLLLLVAHLAADRDDLRRRVSSERLLTPIISGLSSSTVELRIAACECVKALSRSANVLRTGLVEGKAADPLIERLSDTEDGRVRVVALAAVNNLVSDFSPMKEILLRKAVLPRLVEITKTSGGALRLNALTALVNMAYWSESPLKRQVMDALGWDTLIMLTQEPEIDVQEQALCLLRNLAMNTEADITMTIAGIGEARLYNILEEKLRSSHESVVTQAIYALVNIATGNDQQKRPILQRPGITRALLAHMGHHSNEIRLGAIWCIHNIARGVHDNVVRLRSLGFEGRLRDLADDLSLEVRERVSETLAVFVST